jgi:hypothetical protein
MVVNADYLVCQDKKDCNNSSDEEYDSTKDILTHIKRVSELLNSVVIELLDRANNHDKSKLKDPEKKYFDKFSHKLKDVEYGSDEYKKFLEELKPALDHHYKKNSHHPEHYENGIEDMNLFDIIEMLMDWKASSERFSKKSDIDKSIDINKERFNISDQLTKILKNTINYLEERYLV